MAGRLLRVDHPSLQDLDRTAANLEKQILEAENLIFEDLEQRIQESEADHDTIMEPLEKVRYDSSLERLRTLKEGREYIRKFIDTQSYFLGPVFASSGVYRVEDRSSRQVNQPFRLDWELIEVPESRMGLNEPYHYPHMRGIAPRFFRDAEDPQIHQFYVKSGQSTGRTSGKLSGFKEALFHREWDPHTLEWKEKVTWEYAIYGRFDEYVFSRPEDSGSLVYNERSGTVVGLSLTATNSFGHSYFTPINDVFEDIKKVTGAIDVRMG